MELLPLSPHPEVLFARKASKGRALNTNPHPSRLPILAPQDEVDNLGVK